MDVARRWQIVTALTAVGGLGIGALSLGQQPSQILPAIELDPSPGALTPRVAPRAVEQAPGDAEIVAPDVRSFDPSLASASSPASLDSHDEAGASDEPAGTPAGGPVSEPRSVDTDSPDRARSVDSPGSVDSPDSIDSLASDD